MKTVGILGKKLAMTQLPNASGIFRPVTPIWVGSNVISQVKTKTQEGYNSCQIAFADYSEKRLSKPMLGHLKKHNIPPKKFFREIRNMEGFLAGSALDCSLFKEGEKIKVSGISKGKGTAGVIKRHNFGRGRMSHGGGPVHRHGGSMGGGRGTNQGVPKGKKMSGRMGNEKVTQKLVIEKIDSASQIIFIRGGVPGPRERLIILSKPLEEKN